jgi:xylulose-5-phosphate/fructose-6-phosphate phosphoketolase
VLAHAFGAAFDHPDLIAAAVVGDGEAETGLLEGSWKGITFLNPARDGAVLPILHLNGYKIAGPTVLGREDDDNVSRLLAGHGYDVDVVEGDEPFVMHLQFSDALVAAYKKIRAIQDQARQRGFPGQPRWPVIVLRTPKGWTGSKFVDGVPAHPRCGKIAGCGRRDYRHMIRSSSA